MMFSGDGSSVCASARGQKMADMRVSVLIAAYNAEAHVAEAVDSVLNQSRPPDEVIVIDDGSVDRTPAVLEGFGSRIILLSQPNRGQAAALNNAMPTATGDLLGFCDADDLWTRRKLELQVALLGGSKEVDAVFGQIRQFVSPDVPKDQQEMLRPTIEVLQGESKICMLVRRAIFHQLGPFEESLPATFFIEWLGRAKQRGLKSAPLDEIVALRRLHLTNGGRINMRSQDLETLRALRQVIIGRRPQP
jgi:glycosyltransferase involved in cell wall biosynthesis